MREYGRWISQECHFREEPKWSEFAYCLIACFRVYIYLGVNEKSTTGMLYRIQRSLAGVSLAVIQNESQFSFSADISSGACPDSDGIPEKDMVLDGTCKLMPFASYVLH